MKTRIRRYLRVFLSLSLGFLLLWLITRGQDVEQIMLELRGARYRWIIAAILFALISHYLRAIRWNMLIGTMGYQTKASQTFYAVMTGYLANLALPRMGEVTRCITLSKVSRTPFNALAGTVLAERVFDFITLVAIVVVTLVAQFGFLRSFMNRLFWSPLIERAGDHWLPALAILLAVAGLLTTGILFLKHKSKRPREGSFFYKLRRQYRGFANGFRTIATMRRKWWFVTLSVLIWACYFMTVYLCFFAISATSHLGLQAGLTLLAVGSLGILAPVPGGIGTYHFVTIISLTELYGIASEPATSYAYITHATQMLVNIVAGTLSWIILSLQGKRAQHEPPEDSP